MGALTNYSAGRFHPLPENREVRHPSLQLHWDLEYSLRCVFPHLGIVQHATVIVAAIFDNICKTETVPCIAYCEKNHAE